MGTEHVFVEDKGFARAPELGRVTELEAARDTRGSGARLRAVRAAAEQVRARLADGPRVVSLHVLPIATLAYPTKYAFHGAPVLPAPFVVLTHRAVLVQFLQHGEPKTLLLNPTDDVAARATPFFQHLIRQVGDYLAFQVLQKRFESLESQLGKLGLDASDVDYVAFDNFRHQDLRSLLGTADRAHKPRFPNARLLAPRQEWTGWDDLHPLQRAWYVEDGKLNADIASVVLVDRDLELGDGVVLLSTPGLTSGNRTLFVNTRDGVWGVSANGVAADSWSPLDSRIKGLAHLCRRQDIDALPVSGAPESGVDQYTSMIVERTIVDRVGRAPAFCQLFPTSELTPSRLAPGLRPTVLHGKLAYGTVAVGGRARSRRAEPQATAPAS